MSPYRFPLILLFSHHITLSFCFIRLLPHSLTYGKNGSILYGPKVELDTSITFPSSIRLRDWSSARHMLSLGGMEKWRRISAPFVKSLFFLIFFHHATITSFSNYLSIYLFIYLSILPRSFAHCKNGFILH